MEKIWLFLVGNSGVAVDQPRHYPAHGFDAQRERRDVEQQDVVDIASEHAGLDGRAQGHHLVGIDAAIWALG